MVFAIVLDEALDQNGEVNVLENKLDSDER
jgi:hypothetical protein